MGPHSSSVDQRPEKSHPPSLRTPTHQLTKNPLPRIHSSQRLGIPTTSRNWGTTRLPPQSPSLSTLTPPPTINPHFPYNGTPSEVEVFGPSDRNNVENVEQQVDVCDVSRDKGVALHDKVEAFSRLFKRTDSSDNSGGDMRELSESKNKTNLPRKRKISQGLGEDVTPVRKKRSAPVAANRRGKSETKLKLNLKKNMNVITNHFKPSSIAVRVGGGDRDEQGGGGGDRGEEPEAVPITCAEAGTGQSVGEKTMRLVTLGMIGQDMSAAGIQTNTGTVQKSAGWETPSLGQCAQLKK